MATLGEKLKAERKALGLTQQDVTNKTGVLRGTISMWENNQVDNISAEPFLKLAAFYQANPYWLMFDSGNKKLAVSVKPPIEDDQKQAIIDVDNNTQPKEISPMSPDFIAAMCNLKKWNIITAAHYLTQLPKNTEDLIAALENVIRLINITLMEEKQKLNSQKQSDKAKS